MLKASWRLRCAELWHHPLSEPPQVVARALAKEQYVSDAYFLEHGKPLHDLFSCTDQRMTVRRVGVREDVRPWPALRTARE